MDRTNPYVTASYEGRYGTYSVAIYGPSPAPSEPVELTLTSQPETAFGEVSRAFGGALIASSADYRALDPTGELDRLFGDAFDSEDYEARITGPDGMGGTWGVSTRPMQGEEQGSHSPLVTPNAPVALGTHDGLAALEDVDGEPTSYGARISQVLSRLWHAMPGRPEDAGVNIWEVYASFPISVPEAEDELLDKLRFTAELAGDAEKGDFGTVEDQLRALAEGGTLSIYQPTDVATPRWEVCTRSRVGTSLDVSRITGGGGLAGSPIVVASSALPGRQIALPSYTADENGQGAARVRRAGLLRLKGQGQVAFDTPAATLGDFDIVRVVLGQFVPTPGLRFLFPESRTEYADGASAVTLGDYRLELVGDDAVTYYGPDWGTVASAMAPGVTTDDLPTSGSVELVLVGEDDNLDTDNNVGTPDETVAAEFAPSQIALEDDAGEPIKDFAFSLGSPGGQAVELALLPAIEAFDGTDWNEASGYVSALSYTTYGSTAGVMAEIRLIQQGENLRQMTAEVTGIHGPQARFLLVGKDSGNDASPWAEDVELVATGGEPNLDEGWTLMSLTSAKEVLP